MPTRRRDRRIPAIEIRPETRSDLAVRARRASAPAFCRRWNILCTSFICLTCFVLLLIVYVYVYRKYNTSQLASEGLSADERGLVRPQVSFEEILSEHSKVSQNTSHRNFPYPVLAYVTPWNSLGYEMAERFSSKLSHISPVWYELKSEGKKLVLEGRHNADVEWISRLHKNGDSLVLPRFVLEAFPSALLPKKKRREKAIEIIVTECKEMGYDGIVLESWSRWTAYGVLHDPGMRIMALQFIKELGQALHSVSSATNSDHHLELVYVIPAPRSPDLKEDDFGPKDLKQLRDVVDAFSFMTYDFSGPHNPGPNAPLMWIRSSMQLLLDIDSGDRNLARKIFLGINFYGNDFIISEGGGGAITGRDYLSLLERHRPALQWEEKSTEHFFIYSDSSVRHAVFYPSLMSLSLRLDEARNWGAGLSIWEIGQGLDYFFDLL